MLEIELLGALSVIEEDIVIAVYQLGEYGMNFSEVTFFWLFFTPLPCFRWGLGFMVYFFAGILTFRWMKFRGYVLHAVVYAIVKFAYVMIIQ